MHPCLRVPELLYPIFQQATAPDLPPVDSDAYWDLMYSLNFRSQPATHPLALALTCRAFLETGLDIVWYRIPSIDVFKGCLPPQDKPRTSSDWERYNYYAGRVRHFGIAPPWGTSPSDNSHLNNSAEILSELTAAHAGSRILPNLVNLFVYRRDVLDCLEYFVGDRLKTLGISSPELDSRPILSSFCHLEKPCPSLESFHIWNCTLSPEEWTALFQMVSHFTAIQETHLFNGWTPTGPICPEDVLAHLSSLTTLRSISAICAQLGTENPDPGFPALQSFFVVVPDVDNFMRRLASITSSQLVKIIAWVHVEPTVASHVQHGLSVMRDRLAGAPTAEVELLNTQNPPTTEPIPLPAETIHPLLALRNLTRLKLGLHRPVDVDDTLLAKMARCWPKLQALELIHPYPMEVPTRLTLSGLIPLAAQCTELVSCTLCVDATTVPADYLQRPAGRYASRLRSLGVGSSPIDKPHLVAAFLSDLFPELRSVDWAAPDEWMDVNASVKIFRDVRKQERLTKN